MFKNKNLTIMIALFLIISMSASMILTQTANAHTPPWTITSYAYLNIAPNPVGVGQVAAVAMWVDAPLPGATVTNDIRRANYTLTITAPDGTTQTQHWDLLTDTTGIQSYQFTPNQVGVYSFAFDYPQQTYIWGGAYQNDVFTAATATSTLTVQQEPIDSPIDSYPLPTEFWTYPIEGQNTYWYTIASNWLGKPYIETANSPFGIPGAFQPDGSAPDTPHIMWTKPIQYGGLVGGNGTAIPGEMYYSGLSYNNRFANPIIMQGTLFYQEPYGYLGGLGALSGVGNGDYVAVDLKTGKELWRIDPTATGTSLVPSFGYLYSWENPNQHGVLPGGLLIATYSIGGFATPFGVFGGTPAWKAYDPRTGVLLPWTITNVPSGSAVAGPSGEYLIYTLTNLGSNSNPDYYLSEWNSSLVFGAGPGTTPANWYSGTVPGNCPITPERSGNTYWNGSGWVSSSARDALGIVSVTTPAFDWNISLPSLTTTGWGVGTANLNVIPLIDEGNMLLLIQGTFGGHPGDYAATVSTDSANITAISLKPESLGHVLWTKTYQPAPDYNTRFLTSWDTANGVFIFTDKETMVHNGYSLADGNQLWGPVGYTNDTTNNWNFLALGTEQVAYGKLYVSGYAGILYCFDEKTGNLLWTYGNGGEGNSTLSGLATPWGRYPVFTSVIADGKIYLDTTEHSPNSPLYKGALLRALNATTGEEIWTIMNYGSNMYGGAYPVASGYLAALNTYDSQIYCYGQGPSQLIVAAANPVAQVDTPVVIRGTVTDIAAGTNQDEQAARFPNGVPAVSDESMSAWMEYVYMQKPKPTDTTGVPVTLSVIDSNNNYRQIGTTTSDSSGNFGFSWSPDIEGMYTLIATFAGTKGYYGSSSETFFTATTASATPAPTAALQTNIATVADLMMGIAVGVIAIIIAIAIVGLLILRKRP